MAKGNGKSFLVTKPMLLTVHWQYGGRRISNRQQNANQLLLQHVRALLNDKTNNEHLYIYSTLGNRQTNTEYCHIANALTLQAILK